MAADVGPVQRIDARRFGDARGWFTEVYSEAAFAARGIDCRFVQDNHAFSAEAFTLRGLHFQAPPFAQDKLVRCIRGRIFDVAVDLRAGSPTYGDWVGAELTAENGRQLFVPVGFAHAYLTLESDCEVTYKVSRPYAPQSEGGVRWDDPDIAIRWPLPDGITPLVSDKDAILPTFTDFVTPFAYGGRPLLPLADA